eukprot:4923730-Pleurochrysis_carterae.AAC.14
MFIVASLHYRSDRILLIGWTMRYKWGHAVATLPSDEGDYTSLEVGHTFCKSLSSQKGEIRLYSATLEICLCSREVRLAVSLEAPLYIIGLASSSQ